jgi:hypothetical protein
VTAQPKPDPLIHPITRLSICGLLAAGADWVEFAALRDAAGISDSVLSKHGFTVLALAYFGLPSLPPTLARIPVEYFGRALDYLRAHPQAAPGGVSPVPDLDFQRTGIPAADAAARAGIWREVREFLQ